MEIQVETISQKMLKYKIYFIVWWALSITDIGTYIIGDSDQTGDCNQIDKL